MTARFLSKLLLEDDGGFPLTVASVFVYDSNLLGRSVVVPNGFRTDLASVPKLLWNLLPPIGRYDKAAVVHDFLYQHNGVTRSEADRVLLEAMVVSGVAPLARWIIYLGVRIGGWVPWNRYRSAQRV